MKGPEDYEEFMDDDMRNNEQNDTAYDPLPVLQKSQLPDYQFTPPPPPRTMRTGEQGENALSDL